MLTHILILLSIGVLLYALIPRKRNSKPLNLPKLHEIDCPTLKDLYTEICSYMTSDKVVVYEYPTYPKIRITNGSKSMTLYSLEFDSFVIVRDAAGDVLIRTDCFFEKAVKKFEE